MSTERFNGKGDVYAFARPSYPAALFDYLTEKQIISEKTVAADIGAGTGIFSAALCPYVKKVLAVEPNPDMRAAAAKSDITWINGTAENTTLVDKSADIVTAAQAFHWFDKSAFKKECKRILKDNGFVVLIWNNKDKESPVIRDCNALFKCLCPDFKGSSNGFDFEGTAFSDFFESAPERVCFKNHVTLDREHFIKRQLSSSFAPKEDGKSFEEFVGGCEMIFEKYQRDGKIIFPYNTLCFYGKV